MGSTHASVGTGAPVLGVIGGGQLARMLCEAATPMGIHIRVLAAAADEGATAVAPDVVAGEPTDPVALRSFASGVDVLTIDHENVDHETLASLEADGVAVRPSVRTLAFSDKAHQRRSFAEAGIPVPPFEVVDPRGDRSAAVASAEQFAREHPHGVVAKAARGGYDGRAVWMLESSAAGAFVGGYEGGDLVLEPRLELECEVAVLVARNPSGEVRTWPVFETVQVGGMCDEVVYPAPIDPAVADRARRVAESVAGVTRSVGVLAVELFVLLDGTVLLNEIAPRVHNSGHLTIEGSSTSQFAQHLRAILDWPLGPTDMLAPAVVMANVVGNGDDEPRARQQLCLAEVPGAHMHLYGKTPRDRRKVGHVTVLGTDRSAARSDAARAAGLLSGALTPTGPAR